MKNRRVHFLYEIFYNFVGGYRLSGDLQMRGF